jgi:hypothetical protein
VCPWNVRRTRPLFSAFGPSNARGEPRPKALSLYLTTPLLTRRHAPPAGPGGLRTPCLPLPPREHPYSRRPAPGRTQAVPVTPLRPGQRRYTGLTWCGQAPRWDSLILPVPLAKNKPSSPEPYPYPSFGRKVAHWCQRYRKRPCPPAPYRVRSHSRKRQPDPDPGCGWGVNEKVNLVAVSAQMRPWRLLEVFPRRF